MMEEEHGEAVAIITYGTLAQLLDLPIGTEIVDTFIPGPGDPTGRLALRVRGPGLPRLRPGEVMQPVFPQYAHEGLPPRLTFKNWGL